MQGATPTQEEADFLKTHGLALAPALAGRLLPLVEPDPPIPTQAEADAAKFAGLPSARDTNPPPPEHDPATPTQPEADAFKYAAHGAGAVPLPPQTVERPQVTPNAARVGDTLTCTPQTWSGDPTFTYTWFNDAGTRKPKPPSGVTPGQYVVVSGDVGTNVFCVVTASNPGGSSVGQPSNMVPCAAVATRAASPNGKK
jgi:hypothetical protein